MQEGEAWKHVEEYSYNLEDLNKLNLKGEVCIWQFPCMDVKSWVCLILDPGVVWYAGLEMGCESVCHQNKKIVKYCPVEYRRSVASGAQR